jgi:small subunit ribosomal protein S24e
MPNRGGRGRAPGPGKAGQGVRNGQAALEPPMMDRARIIETYGKNVAIKPEWAENPKSPLANHIGNKMAINYQAQSGIINGKKVVR